MQNVDVRKRVFSSDFRTLFQTLARVAVASSWELAAGCSETTTREPAEEPRPTQDGTTVGNGRSQDAARQKDAAVTGDAAQRMDDASTDDDGSTDDDAALDATERHVELDAGRVFPGPWVHLVCSEAGMWSLEQTSLGKSVDYLSINAPHFSPEQRKALGDGLPPGTPSVSTQVLHGTACEGASQPAACLREIDRQLAATTCAAEPCPAFVLTTDGEQVTRTERADITTLLGAVDTETEAAITALLGGGSVGCWAGQEVDGSVRTTWGTQVRAVEGGGYEVANMIHCYGVDSTGTTMVSADGTVKVLSTTFCLGRRPDGLLGAAERAASSELGAHFASATHLEAASVFAFEQLARNLIRLGAPYELVRSARRAALEEVEHARTMGAFAKHFGGEPAAPRITPPPARDALAVALENAVEGCVRETYGALVACHQAEAALDPQVRAAMAQVFEDETRHAQLAWQVAQWLEPQLSEAERDAVQRARRAAYTQLSSELASSLSQDARLHLGLPDATVGCALLAQLDAAVGLQA